MPENELVETKKPWQSKQLVGIAIVIISLLVKIAAKAGWLGADMAHLVSDWLADLLDGGAVLGGAFAGYARLFKNSGKEISLK